MEPRDCYDEIVEFPKNLTTTDKQSFTCKDDDDQGEDKCYGCLVSEGRGGAIPGCLFLIQDFDFFFFKFQQTKRITSKTKETFKCERENSIQQVDKLNFCLLKSGQVAFEDCKNDIGAYTTKQCQTIVHREKRSDDMTIVTCSCCADKYVYFVSDNFCNNNFV